MVTDLVKKKVRKVVRKKAIERRKVWKLNEDDTRTRFEGRVGELVSADAADLWKCFKEGVLKGHCHGLTCPVAFTLSESCYARPPLWKYF